MSSTDRRAALVEMICSAWGSPKHDTLARDRASSALDLALEEAARAVEFSPDSHTAREMQLMIDKAAAIRALMSRPE